MKELKFYNKDRDGNRKICGSMTIKNQTDSSADLFFYGDIVSETWQSECYEEDMAPGDVKEFLDQLDGTENINIHINSGGGSVFGGIAIYNMLRHNNAHKTVYVDGLAASIASVIMMAGDEIVMPKNATVMIHKPSASYFFTTKNADDLRKDADSLDTCQEAIMQTYMTKAKVDKEEIEQKVNDETWLTGEEVAELFDVKVEEANDAVACAGSSMFFCYKNVPTNLTAKEKNAQRENEQKPLSRQDIKEIFNESFSEYQVREKGNRMDKREIAAKITQKKEEIKNLIAQDNLEDAKKARKEMKDLQEKYDLLDEMEQEEEDDIKNQAAAGKANEVKGKKNVVSALVNALRAGFKKRPVAKEDMEVLDAMKEGSDEDGGLTVPADISTTIRTLRRSEDALETIVRTERTTKVKGSRVYEVNADSVPFDTVDEESQFPDVATPVLKKVEYVIKKFGGILKATYELLEDSDENIISYLENWIARKVKATRNALIIKKLDEMTDGFEIEATSVDDLKNIFNVELDPALVAGSKALTNQSGFNWLDKLKDKEGNYILQKDVTNPSKRLLFGTYPVVVMSNKTIKNEATGKVPIYCGNFEEAITLFDREKLTIGISTEAGDLWSKDQTGIKVRERLDCQIVDDMAVYKAEIPADQISEPTKKYRRSELEAMTVDEIKQLATTKSYTITKTKKDEIIEEFITAQKG